jgi:galactose mutarotase-like enzyme
MHSIGETTYEGYPALTLRSPDGLEATYAPGVGMVGCSLRHDGDELLGQRGGLARYEATGSTFGIPLLHPWANRLAGFSYEATGRRVELDRGSPLLHLDPHGLPIHGALAASPHWQVAETAADDHVARLEATLDFGAHPELLELFPFPHELRMDVRLAGTSLRVDTTVRPTTDAPVPVAFGYHPYLRLPNVPRAEWRIELPVNRRLKLDEHMIPTGESEPADEPAGQPLDDRGFDDGYADLDEPAVFALAGGGRRIELRFGAGYPFAQVYAPPDQDLIAYEPMTAPANALQSGWQLPVAAPGTAFAADFELRVARL